MDTSHFEPEAQLQPLEVIGPYRFSLGRYTMRVLDDGTFDVPPNFLSVKAPPHPLAVALDSPGFSTAGNLLTLPKSQTSR